MNYFELFGQPTQFQLDQSSVAKHYQSLQRATHPDRFATASESEKRLAMQKNAQVNDGYAVLRDPILRAEHILTLRGLEVAHDRRSMFDNQFLMQQMMWREQLEELEQSKEIDGLEEMLSQIEQEQSEMIRGLARCLEQNDQTANEAAMAEVAKLKFMQRLCAQIEAAQDRIDEDW